MWDRVIIHSHINQCYAQIEEFMFPELKKVPMVVSENEKSKQGIVLAKNNLAKKYNIKAGESLRDAYQKCPHLVVVQPHYDDYLYYSEEVKNIYREYTDQVESFGNNEAWIDVTSSQLLFGGHPTEIAKEIQQRIYKELGIEVSMGISFNKIFAKIGSDIDKKMGLTVITKKNYKNLIYPLSVSYLLFVGKSITAKLNASGIYTIGQLANSSCFELESLLGKKGKMIWEFANGMDVTADVLDKYQSQPKSIGKEMTTAYSISTHKEIQSVLKVLVDSVVSRLKDQELKGKVVSLYMRDNELNSFCYQKKMDTATNIYSEIMNIVENLIKENYSSQYYDSLDKSYRSVGVRISQLSEDTTDEQFNLFVDKHEYQQEKRIVEGMDSIRTRLGLAKIKKYWLDLHRV